MIASILHSLAEDPGRLGHLASPCILLVSAYVMRVATLGLWAASVLAIFDILWPCPAANLHKGINATPN